MTCYISPMNVTTVLISSVDNCASGYLMVNADSYHDQAKTLIKCITLLTFTCPYSRELNLSSNPHIHTLRWCFYKDEINIKTIDSWHVKSHPWTQQVLIQSDDNFAETGAGSGGYLMTNADSYHDHSGKRWGIWEAPSRESWPLGGKLWLFT